MTNRAVRLPIPMRTHRLDRFATRTTKRWPGYCLVCGRFTIFHIPQANLRESCICRWCESFNRQRQIAYVVCAGLSSRLGLRSLAAVLAARPMTIYNTEASRALHEALKGLPGYQASEYIAPNLRSGEVVNDVRHEDLEGLSFTDASFDLVISGDVMEHVPEPYRGHAELFRVLRPGGRHVFTVPFEPDAYQDDVRARRGPDGAPILLADPIHHLDPVHPEGVLVYTIFGLEMLVKLDQIGFRTRVYYLYKPWFGILGANALVFEATKPPTGGDSDYAGDRSR